MKSMKLALGVIVLVLMIGMIAVILKLERYEESQFCNIAVIPIEGNILAYAKEGKSGTNQDETLAKLRHAENDPNVLGVLVPINSWGGKMAAAEAMANGLKHSSLPVVAQIQEEGLSAAYLIATGAKTIIASQFSDVGGIGITMSYLENSEKNIKEGLKYVSLSSAKFKDYGTENKPLTQDERALFERNLKIWHDYFVKLISENRQLPLEHIKKLADGSSLAGSLALENKLIDQLGDRETARYWFAKHFNINPKDIVFCNETITE